MNHRTAHGRTRQHGDTYMNRLFTLTAGLLLACASGHAAEPAKKTPPRAKPVVKQLLQCKIGPYEKQTRFALETANGKPVRSEEHTSELQSH